MINGNLNSQTRGIPCNLCGFDQFSYLFDEVLLSDHSFSLVRCEKCGLISTRPLPDDEFLAKLYSTGSYRERTVSGAYCLDQRDSGVDYQFVLRRLGTLSNGKRHLDVGCGSGTFLSAAVNRGWDSCGIEPSTYASEIAKRRLGDRMIFNGFLQSAGFEETSFDIITLWYVLEHVTDPTGILTQSYKLLKPGGIIFIAVPNAKYIFFRRRLIQVLTGNPGSVQAHEHLYHYTSRTLRALICKVGFEFISEQIASPYLVSGGIVNRIKQLCMIAASAVFKITGVNLGGILMFGRKIF